MSVLFVFEQLKLPIYFSLIAGVYLFQLLALIAQQKQAPFWFPTETWTSLHNLIPSWNWENISNMLHTAVISFLGIFFCVRFFPTRKDIYLRYNDSVLMFGTGILLLGQAGLFHSVYTVMNSSKPIA